VANNIGRVCIYYSDDDVPGTIYDDWCPDLV